MSVSQVWEPAYHKKPFAYSLRALSPAEAKVQSDYKLLEVIMLKPLHKGVPSIATYATRVTKV